MIDVDKYRRGFAVVAFITAALVCPGAQANPEVAANSARLSRPWGVAAGASAVFMGDQDVPGFAAVGVDAERVVTPWLTLEVGLASGLSSTVASANGDVRTDPKLVVRALARPTLAIDSAGRHALSAGLGPAYLAGRAYDGLWYAHAELGYQFRGWQGFSFLYAIGIDVALNERPPAVSPADCINPTCLGPVTRGTTAIGPRLAIGYTF